jgi:uncharacterized protein (TIGR02145 family)
MQKAMKKTIYTISVIVFAIFVNTYGQKPVIELTFTADNNGQYIPLDSILIKNQTLNCDTVLYAPDTTLVLDFITSLPDNYCLEENGFSISQNYPNPFKDQTSIDIFLPQEDYIVIVVYNLLGKQVASYNGKLDAGLNTFKFYPGNEKCYVFSAIWQGKNRTIKMFNINHGSNKAGRIIYKGIKAEARTYKKQKAIDDDFQNNTYKYIMPPAITIDPPNATAYDELTLIFDPDSACFESGSLAGLPSIAIHSGVTLLSGEQWQFVIEFNSTGANGQSTTLLPTGDGRFSITYTPSEFYGLNGEIVTELCAVFNNGTNWNQDGRDFIPGSSDCMDFFIPLNYNLSYNFTFYPGNELLLVGYSSLGESGLIETPETSQAYTFQFATNIPCPGIDSLFHEEQWYHTIQIYSQCWLKENLNVGLMINGEDDMVDNGVIEKYCYDNEEDNCDIYGGLYQWNEMMQYTMAQGVQGICPVGWHIPTDDEWQILEGTVDSLYGVGDPIWDTIIYRGFDAGKHLKSTTGWYVNGDDKYGFTALPGGWCIDNGNFQNIGYYSTFWTSTEGSPDYPWRRYLTSFSDQVSRWTYNIEGGFYVRCLQD